MSKKEYETLYIERVGKIGRLIVNRPETQNAMFPQMMMDIRDAAIELDQDSSVRVILVEGAGPNFSAGGNLDFLRKLNSFGGFNIKNTIYIHYVGAVRALVMASKPSIAVVRGNAYGGGADLALACDFRIFSETAVFCESWINLNLSSALGGLKLLPQVIGLAKAAELYMFATSVKAEESLRLGICNWLVPDAKLEEEAMKKAEILAKKPPLAMSVIKEGLMRGLDNDFLSETQRAMYAQAMLLSSKDYLEGIEAIQAKRPAEFKGE